MQLQVSSADHEPTQLPGRVAGRECLIEFPNLAYRSCSHSLNHISESTATLGQAFIVW